MVANESVGNIFEKVEERVACKLDLEKAYDYVNWSCLHDI